MAVASQFACHSQHRFRTLVFTHSPPQGGLTLSTTERLDDSANAI
jgi:hypothetical protein